MERTGPSQNQNILQAVSEYLTDFGMLVMIIQKRCQQTSKKRSCMNQTMVSWREKRGNLQYHNKYCLNPSTGDNWQSVATFKTILRIMPSGNHQHSLLRQSERDLDCSRDCGRWCRKKSRPCISVKRRLKRLSICAIDPWLVRQPILQSIYSTVPHKLATRQQHFCKELNRSNKKQKALHPRPKDWTTVPYCMYSRCSLHCALRLKFDNTAALVIQEGFEKLDSLNGQTESLPFLKKNGRLFSFKNTQRSKQYYN